MSGSVLCQPSWYVDSPYTSPPAATQIHPEVVPPMDIVAVVAVVAAPAAAAPAVVVGWCDWDWTDVSWLWRASPSPPMRLSVGVAAPPVRTNESRCPIAFVATNAIVLVPRPLPPLVLVVSVDISRNSDTRLASTTSIRRRC